MRHYEMSKIKLYVLYRQADFLNFDRRCTKNFKLKSILKFLYTCSPFAYQYYPAFYNY